jgi:hypothetical protein
MDQEPVKNSVSNFIGNIFDNYGQFIVMLLVFLVGGGVYYYYNYYKKQEEVKQVNNNLQKQPVSPPPVPKQQAPDFVPSDSFKGQQKGYVFKKGDKGTGYYKENK